MVPLALAILVQVPYHQTPTWIAYVDKIQKAYAMEAQWTKVEAPASTIFHGQPDPRTRRFRLLFRKPDFLLLEEPSVSRTTWNGSTGIELDLVKKTWKQLTTKPDFEEARFLYHPAITPKDNESKLIGKVKQFQANNSNWTMVSFLLHQVDAGSTYDYTFSDRTKLLSIVQVQHRGMMKWTGKLEYRLQTFDTDRMALTTEFPVKPPTGFTEASKQ